MLSIVLSETGQKTERANVLAPPIGHFQSAESMDVEAALSFAATSLDGEVVTNLRAEFQLLIAKNEDNAFDLAKVVVRDYVSSLPDTTKVHLRKLSENIRDLFSAVLLNPQSRESPSSAISLAVAHSKENDLKISIFLESARGWLSNQLSVALLACIVLDLEMNEQEDNGTLIHLFTAALLRALHISLYRFMDSKILSRKPVTLLAKPHVFSATGQRSESSAIHRSAAPPSVFQTFIEYLYDRHRVNDGNHAVIWSSELGCLSPYSALLSFLELKSLYSLLQRLADFLLSSARIFENGGGVDVAHWGTLKGRCCLLASAKSGFEDAESLSTAMSLLLSSPSHLPELSTDAPSPKLAASVYGWSEVLLRDKLTALHKDSVFTTVVSKYSLLDFLGTSILQQMLLVIIRVHHLQSVCELLRRVDAPHDCHIAALKFLAASLEEARQLFVSGNDSDIVIRLGEDLSTAWIALFQRYLYSDSWAECVNAMKYIDASKHEILVEELIETVCERGCLDWLCFDDESKDATHIPGTLQVALQLEKLHLVKDLPGKSVYFEAACVMLLLRKQYFEAARFAYAVYDRQLNGADSERSLRLT